VTKGISRPAIADIAIPATQPMATNLKPCLTTSYSGPALPEPSAILVPTSRVEQVGPMGAPFPIEFCIKAFRQ
jgi:hypothetical protein